MTLQTTGSISLGDIGTEFGDTAPTSLSEFYGISPNVPASGAISISDFYGVSAAPSSIVRTSSARYGGTSTDMTVNGVNIGTAAADRYVVVAIAKRYYAHTSCTIGGIVATNATSCNGVSIWYALVPTGTTASINFTSTNNSGAYAALTTWAVYGGDPANWTPYTDCNINSVTETFNTPATPSAMVAVGFRDDQTSTNFSGDITRIAAYDLNTSDVCAFGEGIFSSAATGRTATGTVGGGLGLGQFGFLLIQ